jgi:hypothetical protein
MSPAVDAATKRVTSDGGSAAAGVKGEGTGVVVGEQDWASVARLAAVLEAALAARAPALQAGTPLVRTLASHVSRLLGLDDQARLAVDVCARVRDIGMIGLPDSVVLSAGPLSPADCAMMKRHPVLGGMLLQSLAGMAAASDLVRAHHERWDGAGYPDGLRGEAIPLASRVVAACDWFVAIATDRPGYRGPGAQGALESLVRERGVQFDPRVDDCLLAIVSGIGSHRPDAPPSNGKPTGRRPARTRRETPEVTRRLGAAIAELDVVPAFAPACERALTATTGGGLPEPRELVSAIESDIGLTIAVLRLAGDRGPNRAGAGQRGRRRREHRHRADPRRDHGPPPDCRSRGKPPARRCCRAAASMSRRSPARCSASRRCSGPATVTRLSPPG